MALDVLKSTSSSSSSSFDFDFNRGLASPFPSSPSSPKGFGFAFFSSTPTTPAHGYSEIEELFTFSPTTSQSPDIQHYQLAPSRNPLQSKKSSTLRGTFSPKRKKPYKNLETEPNERGRTRVSTLSTSESGKREARSLSPEKRRWRLKDLLLFRSASEGRRSNKDPFKKYNVNMTRSSAESSPASSNTKRGQVSAHELHYKTNKAISEDTRKKSFLPYKQGILGRLAVNPTVHALAHGFGSLAHTPHPTKYNY